MHQVLCTRSRRLLEENLMPVGLYLFGFCQHCAIRFLAYFAQFLPSICHQISRYICVICCIFAINLLTLLNKWNLHQIWYLFARYKIYNKILQDLLDFFWYIMVSVLCMKRSKGDVYHGIVMNRNQWQKISQIVCRPRTFNRGTPSRCVDRPIPPTEMGERKNGRDIENCSAETENVYPIFFSIRDRCGRLVSNDLG